MTAPCSIRSPGSRPAASSAASVRTSWTRVTQCTATGRPAACAARDVVGEVVKRRQCGVVEQDLHRPECYRLRRRVGPRRVPCSAAAAPLAASASDARSPAVALGVASVKPVMPSAAALLLTAARSPAAAGTRSATQRSIRHSRPVGRPASSRSTPLELAPVQVQPGDGGGVDHPQRAGAVLHPHRAVGEEPVESLAVQGPGDRLVVADGAQPGARRQVRVRGAQPRRQVGGGPDVRRPGGDAGSRGGERAQVHVVVVQAGQQVPPAASMSSSPGSGRSARRAFGDPAAGQAHVGNAGGPRGPLRRPAGRRAATRARCGSACGGPARRATRAPRWCRRRVPRRAAPPGSRGGAGRRGGSTACSRPDRGQVTIPSRTDLVRAVRRRGRRGEGGGDVPHGQVDQLAAAGRHRARDRERAADAGQRVRDRVGAEHRLRRRPARSSSRRARLPPRRRPRTPPVPAPPARTR